MRPIALTTLLFSVFIALSAAWTKEDHEIFRLKDEVDHSEGAGVTFYDFVGVDASASQDQINKAYRKKSRQIHPDKAVQSFRATYTKPDLKTKPKDAPPKDKSKDKPAKKKPGVTVRKQPSDKELDAFRKEASQRYAMLSTVANILRGPERDRYDHFLKNGFPKWRGTGYYYSRFRPGLVSVLVGLFIALGGAAHYGAIYLSWSRRREFVDRYIKHARRMAWGDELGIPGVPTGISGVDTETPPQQEMNGVEDNGPQNRKQRRMQEREARKGTKDSKAAVKARASGISTPVEAELTSGPVGAKKRVQAENGKVLIVDSTGNVFLEETTEEGETHEYLLDPDEIAPPTIYDTVLFKLPRWAYNKSVGKFLGKHETDLELDPDNDAAAADGDDVAAIKSALATNPNAESRKRKPRVRQK